MLVALFVFAAAAAAPWPGGDSEPPRPSRIAGGPPHGEDTADNAALLTTPASPADAGADSAAADLRTTAGQRGADLCDRCGRPPLPAFGGGGASEFKDVRNRHATPSVFLVFLGGFRTRRSSETPLPTRDKHFSPIHTLTLTGQDVENTFGVLRNVHLFSEKDLRPHKAIQNSSQSPLEDSFSANSDQGLSSPASVSEAERDEQPKAVSTTEELSSPVISSASHLTVPPRDEDTVPADTPIPSHVQKFQKVELNAGTGHATKENITLAYNEYQSIGGSNAELQNTAEQVVFTDKKYTPLSSGNYDSTVVEVEISKSEMAVAQKETEEVIMKDTTLIIVFSCLAVLVLVVCKIVRYVMEYKLSKYEERMQSARVRPPC